MHPRCPSERLSWISGEPRDKNVICVVSFRRWHASLASCFVLFFFCWGFAYAEVVLLTTHITMHMVRSNFRSHKATTSYKTFLFVVLPNDIIIRVGKQTTQVPLSLTRNHQLCCSHASAQPQPQPVKHNTKDTKSS
ncbi:hypothetical protein V8C35DRAFT_315591 [Trichoderma chlorosporum]